MFYCGSSSVSNLIVCDYKKTKQKNRSVSANLLLLLPHFKNQARGREWPVTKINFFSNFWMPSSLQAVVVVGGPVDVALVKGHVCVHAVRGGFDGWVLRHAPNPLLQLWSAVSEANKRKGKSIEKKKRFS